MTTDGTHRTHLARLLDLPFLLAKVTLHSLPLTFDLLGMVAEDPAGRPAEMVSDKHLKDRLDLWRGLQRRDLIDGEVDSSYHWTTTELRCRRLPAFWWLCSPAFAIRVNTEYERLYPGTLATHGIPNKSAPTPTPGLVGSHADRCWSRTRSTPCRHDHWSSTEERCHAFDSSPSTSCRPCDRP